MARTVPGSIAARGLAGAGAGQPLGPVPVDIASDGERGC